MKIKLSFCRLKTFVCALLLGCVISMVPLKWVLAMDESLYIVDDQLVDVTADNPVQARENAIFEVQRTAFNVLAERMLPEDEFKALPSFSDEVIASLVRDFSVKNERIAPDRYTANFTLRFDALKVEQAFGKTGLAYSETESQPVIVLPFLQMGSRLLIWEEPNPWRDVWQNAVLDDGLVPIRVPLGDITDMADVPDASIFSGQAGNLAAIAGRYGAQTVFLAVAKSRGAPLETSEGVLITLYAASGHGIKRVNEFMVPAGDGATFNQAMNTIVGYIRNEWKAQTMVVNTLAPNTIAIRVPFDGLPQWIEIKQYLEGVPLIDTINSDSMTHDRADLTVAYTGTLEGLRLALLQTGLVLSETPLDDGEYLLKQQSQAQSYYN